MIFCTILSVRLPLLETESDYFKTTDLSNTLVQVQSVFEMQIFDYLISYTYNILCMCDRK